MKQVFDKVDILKLKYNACFVYCCCGAISVAVELQHGSCLALWVENLHLLGNLDIFKTICPCDTQSNSD